MTDRPVGSDQSSRTYFAFVPGRARQRTSPDPPPPWLADAVDVVLADLQRSGATPLRVGYEADPELPRFGSVSFETPEQTRFGFGILEDGTRAALLVAIADGVQEHLFETQEYWAQATPQCPGHSHPAHPALSSGTAWWVCPLDGRRLAPIGSLARSD